MNDMFFLKHNKQKNKSFFPPLKTVRTFFLHLLKLKRNGKDTFRTHRTKTHETGRQGREKEESCM